jgi:hypothetical protein
MSTTQIEAAQKWSILLRSQARQSHSAQLGSSSLIDLANTLDDLLTDHKALGDKCNDYDTLKQRVEELEGAAKRQQGLKSGMRPAVVKTPPRAVDEDDNNAVA